MPRRQNKNYHRHDNLSTNILTPRTFQVSLLDSAKLHNVVGCVDSCAGNGFIVLTLIKEYIVNLTSQSGAEQKKNAVCLLQDDQLELLAHLLYTHTNLDVCVITKTTDSRKGSETKDKDIKKDDSSAAQNSDVPGAKQDADDPGGGVKCSTGNLTKDDIGVGDVNGVDRSSEISDYTCTEVKREDQPHTTMTEHNAGSTQNDGDSHTAATEQNAVSTHNERDSQTAKEQNQDVLLNSATTQNGCDFQTAKSEQNLDVLQNAGSAQTGWDQPITDGDQKEEVLPKEWNSQSIASEQNQDVGAVQNVSPNTELAQKENKFHFQHAESAQKEDESHNEAVDNAVSASFNALASLAAERAAVATKNLGDEMTSGNHLVNNNEKKHLTYKNSDDLSKFHWADVLATCDILIMSQHDGMDIIRQDHVPASCMALLIIDHCHLATEIDSQHAGFMSWLNEQSDQPRLLGLTTALLNMDWESPSDLVAMMGKLEKIYNASMEIDIESMVASIHGSKINEELQICPGYIDRTGMIDKLGAKIEIIITFLRESNLSEEMSDEENKQDVLNLCMNVLQECHTILSTLGPWCCGQVAKSLSKQVMKMEEAETLEWPKLLLQLLLKELCELYTMVDIAHLGDVYDLEQFHDYLSPTVLELLKLLYTFKPNDNFVIVGDEEFPDMDGMSDDSLDSMDLSDSEDKDKDSRGDKTVHYVAVKRMITGDKEKDEVNLSGVVILEERHAAFTLNKLIEELCIWDPDLYFIESAYIAGRPRNQKDVTKNNSAYSAQNRRQETMLRKFRNQEINLIISTQALEEGIDLPRCNLIVKFGPPSSYKSYINSKSQARGFNPRYVVLADEERMNDLGNKLETYRGIEQILVNQCIEWKQFNDDAESLIDADDLLPPYYPHGNTNNRCATMSNAIHIINRYCAKLPSDAFTHLTPKCQTHVVTKDGEEYYVAELWLPINSPIKTPIIAEPMRSHHLAKMASALKTCEVLHKHRELDDQLMPVGKEIIKYEDEENEWEDSDGHGALPGTTKRKQCYSKKPTTCLLGGPSANIPCVLYLISMRLSCAITEEQNTRGRTIHAPETTPQDFGLVMCRKITNVPNFPIFTRSGEETISINLLNSTITFNEEQLALLWEFHHMLFKYVLRLEKPPMVFDPQNAPSGYIVVPLNKDKDNITAVDWKFAEKIKNSELYTKPQPAPRMKRNYYCRSRTGPDRLRRDVGDVKPEAESTGQSNKTGTKKMGESVCDKKADGSASANENTASNEKQSKGKECHQREETSGKTETTAAGSDTESKPDVENKSASESTKQKKDVVFEFNQSDFCDTVVMPSYRNKDQPQYFYVAEIRMDLTPLSPFPSPELYRTFQSYYSCKYGLEITQGNQPLLDVDHTSLRLNLITPRYMNQKGVALPTSSMATRQAKRENLQQKQILVPELCDIHPFPASFWRKAVCIPAILYRTSSLLLAEELRCLISVESKVGVTKLQDDFCFSELEFGFSTKPVDATPRCADSDESSTENKQSAVNVDNAGSDCNVNGIDDSADVNAKVIKDMKPEDLIKTSQLIKNGVLKHDLHSTIGGATVKNNKDSIDVESQDNAVDVQNKANLVLNNTAKCNRGNGKSETGVVEQANCDKNNTLLIDSNTNDITVAHPCPDIEIDFDVDNDLSTFIGPSPCVILQALTMSNASDFFNLERLETIGDSFLKFAITIHLYCTYTGIHEGKLSYLRSKQVSNFNLYRLGKLKNFPSYIIASKFEPTENWLPPGYILLNAQAAAQANAKEEKENPTKSQQTPQSPAPEGSSEMDRFTQELEAITQTEDLTEASDGLIPYNLQTQHSLADKSIADVVESLIGCYLTTCSQRAALMFMAWLGLNVLPEPAIELAKKIKTPHNSGKRRHASSNTSVIPSSADSSDHQETPPPLTDGEQTTLPPQVTIAPRTTCNLGIGCGLEEYLESFSAFEECIHYKFNDRLYLLQAFTHASYHYNNITDCYQRLEFLGDAILDYVITRHLFEDPKKHSPGVLTDLRSALVNNNIFASLAVKWNFHKYFLSLSPQLFTVMDKFISWQKSRNDEINIDEEFGDGDDEPIPETSPKQCDVEDMEIPKALGDIFESVAGAIYLDSGMSLNTVWRVFYGLMKPQIDMFTAKIPKSPVRELLELEPETAKFNKPEHTMDGKIRVTVNVVGKGRYSGVGRNYRIAKSAAAKHALKQIKIIAQQIADGVYDPMGTLMHSIM